MNCTDALHLLQTDRELMALAEQCSELVVRRNITLFINGANGCQREFLLTLSDLMSKFHHTAIQTYPQTKQCLESLFNDPLEYYETIIVPIAHLYNQR